MIIRMVKSSNTGSRTARVCSAKRRPAFTSSASPTLRLNIGMNAAEKAPSAKSARNMFGSRKATKKASDAKLAPTKLACSVSRTSASTRLTSVSPPTDPSERARFIG
jgi:hypothetical protein